MEPKSICALVDAYNRRYSETSLAVRLCRIQQTEDPSDNDNPDIIRVDNIRAECYPLPTTKLVHVDLSCFKTYEWISLTGVPCDCNPFYAVYDHSKLSGFAIKLILPKSNPLPAGDLLNVLITIFRQIIPQFGGILLITTIHLPFTIMGDVYCDISMDAVTNCIKKCNILAHSMEIGSLEYIEFQTTLNGNDFIDSVKRVMKHSSSLLNLDSSLKRNGLDSLQIASVEYELRQKYDDSAVPMGLCLKAGSVRELIGFVNGLKKFLLKDAMERSNDSEEDVWPLSEAQKQLLALFEIDCEAKEGFFEDFEIELDGCTVVEMMTNLKMLIESNSILRLKFGKDSATLVSASEAFGRVFINDVNNFNLTNLNPTMGLGFAFLIEQKATYSCHLSARIHHILLDGRSTATLVQQLLRMFDKGNSQLVKSAPLYRDYVNFETKHLKNNDFTLSLSYWTTKIASIDPPTPTKTSKVSGSVYSVEIPSSTSTNLLKLASVSGSSLFATFYTLFRCFMHKLHGPVPFPVLIPVDNRLSLSFENTLGLFVNLVISNFQLYPEATISQIINAAESELSLCLIHSFVPFHKVIAHLRKVLKTDDIPLPETMLVHDRIHLPDGCTLSIHAKKKYIQVSQIWYLREFVGSGRMQIVTETRDGQSPEVIQKRQLKRFVDFLGHIVKIGGQARLADIDLLTLEENVFFQRWREILTSKLTDVSVIDQIWYQIKSANESTPVLRGDFGIITAQEMVQLVKNFEKLLLQIFNDKLVPNCVLGLAINRTPALIGLVLTCWRLGLGSLIIADEWPSKRVHNVIGDGRDFGLIGIITDRYECLKNKVDCVVLDLNNLSNNFTQNQNNIVNPIKTDTQIAYLTFTSGSTGNPKAVASTELGLRNIAQNYKKKFNLSADSVIYNVVNPAFDVFYADLVSAFCHGGCLYLSSSKIPKLHEVQACTHAYIMPAYLTRLNLNKSWLCALASLKAVLYGGEVISQNFLKAALAAGVSIFQQFGVTEHAIYSNVLEPKSINDNVVVGGNLSNYHGYLVDSDGCRLPPENIGATCGFFRSTGIGISLGYVGKNTDNKIFGTEMWPDKANEWRYFDTGDRMCFTDDANDENPWSKNLTFLGRNDSIVKIRGNRIDLTEVKQTLLTLDGVVDAVTLYDANSSIIVAGLICQNRKTLITIETALRTILPAYMIPSKIEVFDNFPLNSNGKIDSETVLQFINKSKINSKSLVSPFQPVSKHHNLNLTAQSIFSKHLKIPTLTVDDNLLLYGADSLTLLMALNDLEETTGFKISLKTVFIAKTIRKCVETGSITEATSTSESINASEKVASIVSQNLWFLAHFEVGQISDNYHLHFKLKSPHFIHNFSTLVRAVLHKHTILRTLLIDSIEAGCLVYKILPVEIAMTKITASSRAIIEKQCEFDLSKDPPIMFKLTDTTLEVVCHHIAVDGWSLRILIETIVEFDESVFPSLNLQPDMKYFEFAQLQRKSKFETELNFFKKSLCEVVDFSMLTDFTRSKNINNIADRVITTFTVDYADAIISEFQFSMFAVFLTIYADSLFKTHADFDVLAIGLPFANRTPYFKNTVGYFVNSLPIVIRRKTSFTELATHVHNQLLQMTEHSAVPFELIIQDLNPPRNPYKHAIFQVMFIFEDARVDENLSNSFKFTEVSSENAKFEQTWRIKRVGETEFRLEIEFIKELFKIETIDRSKNAFLNSVIMAFQLKSPKTVGSVKDGIQQLWSNFLNVEVDEIQDETNFFEIGGHSLTAVRLCQAVSKLLQRSVGVKVIFEHQTFGNFCEASIIPTTENTTLSKCHLQLHPVNPLQLPLLKKLKLNPSLTSAYTHRIDLQVPSSFTDKCIKTVLTSLCLRQKCLCLTFSEVNEKWFMQHQNPSAFKFLSKPLTNGIDIRSNQLLQAYRNSENNNIITLEISHLVADGHSMNVLAEDLKMPTSSILSNAETPSYVIFSDNFRAHYDKHFSQNFAFWKMFLQNSDANLESDFPAKQVSTVISKAGKLNEFIIKNGASIVSSTSARFKVSPFAVLMHSLAFRLRERLADFNSTFRIAFCKDLRIIDNSVDYFKSIGFFVGTFVLPAEKNDKLDDTATKLSQIDEHIAFNVDDISAAVAENGDEKSLFDVMLVHDNAPVIHGNENNEFKVIKLNEVAPKSPLTFFVQNTGKDLNVKVESDENLWSKKSVESIVSTWMAALDCDYQPKKKQYQHRPLEMAKNEPYPSLSTLLKDAFISNASNTAFLTEANTISYETLHLKVLSVARTIKSQYLLSTGTLIQPDVVIPVLGNKCVETWFICLGIVFAGAAYLPIDVKLTPIDRIYSVFKQVKPIFVISETPLDGPWQSVSMTTVLKNFSQNSDFLSQSNNSNDLAYAIMTSGTTGPPKAVAATHIGVVNMIADAIDFLKINQQSVIFQFTNFCFDNSVLEVFAGLAAGATLFIPNNFQSFNFVDFVTQFGITHAMLFPGLVNTFTDTEMTVIGSLECWVTGAEKVSRPLFERFFKMRTTARLVQNYGPTETTAYVLRKELKEHSDPQNLGTPMPGATVKVVRPDGWEVAVGSKGELHVASRGLMRGYIGQAFQPFVEFSDDPGIKYYPTGDICIRLSSNEIKFIGRCDNQVKIRGFRVELDEIDTTLATQPNVASAKAVVDPKTGQDIIAFYIEKTPTKLIDAKELRNLLKTKLPHYAIPRKLIKVDSFPLTANSKVDVDALLKGITHNCTLLDSPKLTKVSLIRQIWAETLQISPNEVHDDDNFFYYGGNSLSAAKFLALVVEHTGIKIDATEFFKNPTICELENMTKNGNIKNLMSPTSTINNEKLFPLSYQQQQMLYLNNLNPLGVYNLLFIQEFKPTLNLDRFKHAILQLIKANDILRTKVCEKQFPKDSDNVIFAQKVEPFEAVVPLIQLAVTKITDWNEVKADLMKFKFHKFDLFNELPMRCKILQDSITGKIVVVLVMHHIASDGFSTGLIENQLKRFYEGAGINEVQKSSTYGHYATIQRSPDTHRRYIKLLKNYDTQLGSNFTKTGGFLSVFNIIGDQKPKELSQKCRSFQFVFPTNRNLPATAFTLLVNAIKTVVYSYQKTADKTLIIAAPCANRSDPQFLKTIGNFLTNFIYPATSAFMSLKRLECELLDLSKLAEIPFSYLSKHLRKQFGKDSLDVQVFVNCRYDIEDENDISNWPEAVPTSESTLLKDIFSIFVNYPIEVDLDEYPNQRTKVTIRVSESFFADSKMVNSIFGFIDKLKTEILTSFTVQTDQMSYQKPLITLISQCLNVSVSEIDLSESFFDNGGDSFALWRFHRAVLAGFNKNLELSELIKANSIAQMIALIEKPKQRPTSLPISTSTVTELFTRVNLSTNDSLGVIIIFVYPLIGGSLSYSRLVARLKQLDQARKIQTIVGLAPLASLDTESLEKLARLHLSDLNRRYGLSKFLKTVFIGASFGATLGFELAKQLSAQFVVEKQPPKAVLKQFSNKQRVANFKVTSHQATPQHSVASSILQKPTKSTRTRPESKVKLISIDGTIKTLKSEIPTFDDHRKQIVKIGERHEIDAVMLVSEVETSWKLINLAGFYKAKAIQNVDVLLLRVRQSTDLEMLWRQVCGNMIDVDIIPANHENMLMEPYVEVVAQKVLVWI